MAFWLPLLAGAAGGVLGSLFGGGSDHDYEPPPPPPPAPTSVMPNKKGKKKKKGGQDRFGVAQRPEELGILRLAKGGKLGEVQNPVLYQSLFG